MAEKRWPKSKTSNNFDESTNFGNSFKFLCNADIADYPLIMLIIKLKTQLTFRAYQVTGHQEGQN